MSQVQVFFLVRNTLAKQHWKRSTGTIRRKKNHLIYRADGGRQTKTFTSERKKTLKTGKQDPIGKIAQQIKAPALKTDHQSLIPFWFPGTYIVEGKNWLLQGVSNSASIHTKEDIHSHAHKINIHLFFYKLARMELIEHHTKYCSGTISVQSELLVRKTLIIC